MIWRLRALLSCLLLIDAGCAHNTVAAAPPGPTTFPSAAVGEMLLPSGCCAGQYTDEARKAGVEGTVILDLVVGEDGWVRNIAIVQGLTHGLNDAAVRTLKGCRFTPGERDGKPVAVRVRRFEVVFSLGQPK